MIKEDAGKTLRPFDVCEHTKLNQLSVHGRRGKKDYQGSLAKRVAGRG